MGLNYDKMDTLLHIVSRKKCSIRPGYYMRGLSVCENDKKSKLHYLRRKLIGPNLRLKLNFQKKIHFIKISTINCSWFPVTSPQVCIQHDELEWLKYSRSKKKLPCAETKSKTALNTKTINTKTLIMDSFLFSK